MQSARPHCAYLAAMLLGGHALVGLVDEGQERGEVCARSLQLRVAVSELPFTGQQRSQLAGSCLSLRSYMQKGSGQRVVEVDPDACMIGPLSALATWD